MPEIIFIILITHSMEVILKISIIFLPSASNHKVEKSGNNYNDNYKNEDEHDRPNWEA